MTFHGKVVLITGASSGIGAETALYFSKLGASVALTGRNETNLNAVAKKCGGKCLVIPGDVTKEADAKKIVDQTIKTFVKLDVLVNNAGFGIPGSIENVTIEEFDSVFNVNVKGVLRLTQMAVPHLEKTKGNVVNVSSLVAFNVFPNILSYSMSKSAIEKFNQCCAIELGPKKIRVNNVNPGLVKTNFLTVLGYSEDLQKATSDEIKRKTPLGNIATSLDCAKAIAFLADNDLSGSITGTSLLVDGGAHLTQ